MNDALGHNVVVVGLAFTVRAFGRGLRDNGIKEDRADKRRGPQPRRGLRRSAWRLCRKLLEMPPWQLGATSRGRGSARGPRRLSPQEFFSQRIAVGRN